MLTITFTIISDLTNNNKKHSKMITFFMLVSYL